MIAYLKALWSAVKRGSKTIIGALVMVAGFAVDHVEEIKSALAGYGISPWIVTAAGLVLLLIGKAASEMREKEAGQ